MSIWFTKRERSGRTTRYSASIPFTLVFMLVGLLVVALLPVLFWFVRLFR